MSRGSRSAGSFVTAAATLPFASIAKRRRRTGTASWHWLSIAYPSGTQRTKERSMDVGMMMVFASYGWENCSDARVWDEEIRLARLAADLGRSEEHTSELQSQSNLVCRLLLEKKTSF